MLRPLAVFVGAVLLFSASFAHGSMSIVADLDSNATNGPDTLLIEPTNTVLVYLWFTGSDSIGAFGVTLGDTSGALTWVEEADSLVYDTPSGWTDVSIPVDSLGWILLQSTDFAFSTPIHGPYPFARLKFFVTPGDSCGNIEWDPEVSGWFEVALGQSSFANFEAPLICVDSVLDGAEEGGSGGGSEDDSQDAAGGGGGEENGGGDLLHPRLFFSWPSDSTALHDKIQAHPGDTLAAQVLLQAAYYLDHVDVIPRDASLGIDLDTFPMGYTDPVPFLGIASLLYHDRGDDSLAGVYASKVNEWITFWVDSIPDWNGKQWHCNQCVTVANFVKAYDWTESSGLLDDIKADFFHDSPHRWGGVRRFPDGGRLSLQGGDCALAGVAPEESPRGAAYRLDFPLWLSL